MLTKNERNFIKALRSRENRHKENLMVVEGLKGVLELLNSSVVTKRIYAKSSLNIEEITHLARKFEVEICQVSTKDMEIISSMKKAPGVLAVGEISYSNEENLISQIKNPSKIIPTLLMLDDLADPGNVGTLIRTAHWFGLAGVVCSPRTADAWNPKAIQSSMGSVFNIPIIVSDLAQIISSHKLSCATLDTSGTSIYESDEIPNTIIVGSESHGITKELRELSDMVWAIPGSKNAESLNASIAGAIVCSEISRRWSLNTQVIQ